jgi:RNA polymerase sigma-70 factor (ECF subfamily)
MFDFAMMTVSAMETDSERIARGLRRRELALLDQLVEQYQYRLVRYLIYLTGRRDLVDDIVQETWLRVVERGSSYDGRSRFEPWLFSIARNLTIDQMRKRKAVSLDTPEE